MDIEMEIEQRSLSVDRLARVLRLNQQRVRMVLDTDAFNEVDDQFAIAHLMVSPERVKLEAVYAAPFHNDRSDGPADGMERSYNEIFKVLDALAIEPAPPVFRGATMWLDPAAPERSPAVLDLVARARAASPEFPLHVVALGAITNIAAALLTAPEILENVVVTWIAGHILEWSDAADFNLRQDIRAAQVVFDSGVPLALIPAMGVSSHMICTVPELEEFLEPHSAIGSFLARRFKAYRPGRMWSKEIWDVAAAAWLLDSNWISSQLIPRPIVTDQATWSFSRTRPLMLYVSMVDRDAIMSDVYTRLKSLGEQQRSTPAHIVA